VPAAVVLTGWYWGFAIAAVLIAVVVILVADILALARKIGTQALDITGALNDSRENTQPLWEVEKVNDSIRGIIKDAQQARIALGGDAR